MTDRIPESVMKEARDLFEDPHFRPFRSDNCIREVAKALLARDRRAAEIADRWLSTFGSREIKHTSAREYACDAVSDIRDAILSYDEAQK